MTCIIGIDPGLSGAIAIYWPGVDKLEIHDMPTLKASKGRDVDMAALFDLLTGDPGPVFLEQVQTRPGESGTSALKIGRGDGAIRMAVTANMHPLHVVGASAWKAHFGLKAAKGTAAKDRKEMSMSKARQLMPQHAHLFPLKKHDGRAEAALIALYGAQKGA